MLSTQRLSLWTSARSGKQTLSQVNHELIFFFSTNTPSSISTVNCWGQARVTFRSPSRHPAGSPNDHPCCLQATLSDGKNGAHRDAREKGAFPYINTYINAYLFLQRGLMVCVQLWTALKLGVSNELFITVDLQFATHWAGYKYCSSINYW